MPKYGYFRIHLLNLIADDQLSEIAITCKRDYSGSRAELEEGLYKTRIIINIYKI